MAYINDRQNADPWATDYGYGTEGGVPMNVPTPLDMVKAIAMEAYIGAMGGQPAPAATPPAPAPVPPAQTKQAIQWTEPSYLPQPAPPPQGKQSVFDQVYVPGLSKNPPMATVPQSTKEALDAIINNAGYSMTAQGPTAYSAQMPPKPVNAQGTMTKDEFDKRVEELAKQVKPGFGFSFEAQGVGPVTNQEAIDYTAGLNENIQRTQLMPTLNAYDQLLKYVNENNAKARLLNARGSEGPYQDYYLSNGTAMGPMGTEPTLSTMPPPIPDFRGVQPYHDLPATQRGSMAVRMNLDRPPASSPQQPKTLPPSQYSVGGYNVGTGQSQVYVVGTAPGQVGSSHRFDRWHTENPVANLGTNVALTDYKDLWGADWDKKFPQLKKQDGSSLAQAEQSRPLDTIISEVLKKEWDKGEKGWFNSNTKFELLTKGARRGTKTGDYSADQKPELTFRQFFTTSLRNPYPMMGDSYSNFDHLPVSQQGNQTVGGEAVIWNKSFERRLQDLSFAMADRIIDKNPQLVQLDNAGGWGWADPSSGINQPRNPTEFRGEARNQLASDIYTYLIGRANKH